MLAAPCHQATLSSHVEMIRLLWLKRIYWRLKSPLFAHLITFVD